MRPEVAVARWTAERVAAHLGGELIGEASVTFDAVTTDSRTAREGTAFFALDGSRVRGVEFVPAAFGSGCSVVVAPRDWEGEPPAGRAAVRVSDPLEALANLAIIARNDWSCPVVAVTGSTGKTTVKEMAAHVLAGRANVLRSPGNFNTIVGLAPTLLNWPADPELVVLEVGASEPGEIARLARIVRPTAAALTNVAPAHLEGFGGVEQVAREKGELLAAVPAEGLCVIDGDDPRVATLAPSWTGRVERVGLGPDNDLRAIAIERRSGGGTTFQVARATAEREAFTAELAVPGEHQVRNALVALALAAEHGVELPEGIERLREFHGVAGRLAVSVNEGVTVVDDTYNSNPASVGVALDWFRELEAKRKAVALGDMLELGEGSRRYHQELGRQVAELRLDLAIFVGPESRAAFEEGSERAGDPSRYRHVSDSVEAARTLRSWVRAGDAVLVKGSRGMCMERVVIALTEGESADAL
jgi:UDP-N-acetylmuramoyl-tripeptide--D-alanyl-D-alanine ligase